MAGLSDIGTRHVVVPGEGPGGTFIAVVQREGFFEALQSQGLSPYLILAIFLVLIVFIFAARQGRDGARGGAVERVQSHRGRQRAVRWRRVKKTEVDYHALRESRMGQPEADSDALAASQSASISDRSD
ncbi:hypothetical protein [Pontivivens ytuae]|uniref:Uncharacterized protein n=1 Tax=Pontivivens ytuae TaxID=2789856 RepID=A0A7S9LRC6_9RHOB|nr:hypothetical protein [Pontivivens ytuae]QPH53711.1 hypothetical protein I0K15_18325 [Pontivivens ytuae]